MAMCSTGSLGIISAPQGGCSSLCAAVGVASGSLSTLSTCAGKSAPHSMLEFYGYAGTATAIYFSNICECYSTDLNCVCGVAGSNCVGTVYCYWLDKMAGKTSAAVCIYCNGTAIRCCSILGSGDCSVSGAFAVFTHDGNDCVCVCTRALDVFGDSYAYSRVALCSLSQCVGCFCIGAPAGAESNDGLIV